METFNLSFPLALLFSISPRMGRIFLVIRRSGRRALVFVPSLGRGGGGRGVLSLRRQMVSLRRLFPFIRRLFSCSFRRGRFSFRRLLVVLHDVSFHVPTQHYDTSEDDNLSPVPLISPTRHHDTSEDYNPHALHVVHEPERFFEPGLFRELERFHFFSCALAGSLVEEVDIEEEEWEDEEEEEELEGHEEEEAHTHPTSTVYITVPAAPPLHVPNTRVHVIILGTPSLALTFSASSVSMSSLGPPLTRTCTVTFSSTVAVYNSNPSLSVPSFQLSP
ncbi:hypothetical protein QBC32DRAFT_314948 [Pseudoneurospora amorphoporcata]|uniref:Uncharacterized protein n=1 Tax=Pseudoneurospora amorphoporcata TaxID=241081 RepID=A0AAN6NUM6_9PEZI|nr:hypothetical protein QBC32DRAFT_314948 [Pseudoneurospora amorphoporcata]